VAVVGGWIYSTALSGEGCSRQAAAHDYFLRNYTNRRGRQRSNDTWALPSHSFYFLGRATPQTGRGATGEGATPASPSHVSDGSLITTRTAPSPLTCGARSERAVETRRVVTGVSASRQGKCACARARLCGLPAARRVASRAEKTTRARARGTDMGEFLTAALRRWGQSHQSPNLFVGSTTRCRGRFVCLA
jgi:hypothetical protein